MFDHGLSTAQITLIRKILLPYAKNIEQVGLFGSRATVKYRPDSDIDLVIYGNLTEEEMNRIWTLFDNSLLPVKVDVRVYDLVDYPPLKNHIDEVMQILFTKENLLSNSGEKNVLE